MRLKYFLTLVLMIVTLGGAQGQSTYVIVHGAWGGAWQFKKAAQQLQAAGQVVYRPTLTGLGERHHLYTESVDLKTHIKDVVNTILFEDLKEVILVGHSYGGMVVTGVADSIPERIKKIVYLDAVVPGEGQSLVQSMGMDESNTQRSLAIEGGRVVPAWVRDTTKTPRDVPHPLASFIQPLNFSMDRLSKLPITYVFTYESDKGGKEKDEFYRFYQKAKERNWKIVELEASHNPQIDKLNELVAILLEEK